jgi:hypothetical protein
MGVNPSSFIAIFSIFSSMVDIGLSINDIHILIDDNIVDPIRIDLVSQIALSHGVVVIVMV